MTKLNKEEFEAKLAAVPEVEPTEEEKAILAAAAEDNEPGMELEEFKRMQQYNGRLTLRLPRSLHKDLMEAAKREGVSLNQYALYKLTRN